MATQYYDEKNNNVLTFVAKSNTHSERCLQLTITQEKNVAENKSILNWKFESIGGKEGVNYVSTYATTIKINGTQVYYVGAKPWDGYEFPAARGSVSGSITVTHNSDGSLTVPVYFKTGVYASAYHKDYGGTFVLDKIERASTVSCTDADIGTAPTITIKTESSALRHTLRYSFGSLSGTIVEKTSATSYSSWVLPASFYNELPNEKTGTATIYCDTYSGDAKVGTKSCTFTVTASSNTSGPTIPTILIIDTNDASYKLTGNRDILIRYYSTASVAVYAEAKNGATIVSKTTTNGGVTITGDSCEFPNVESGYFSFSATDSRGYTTTVGRDLVAAGKFVDYVKLTCTLEDSKPDINGNITISCSGNYFNGSFGATDNSLTVQYRYKALGGTFGNWVNMTITKQGNSYTASVDISGLDYKKAYVFETQAKDALMTVNDTSRAVKSLPLFHWGENDFVFEAPVQFNGGITGDFTLKENLRLKGDGNYGNFIYFGDGSYTSIGEPEDDVLQLKASVVKVDALAFLVNGTMLPNIENGEWTPQLYIDNKSLASASYTVQKGWYQKIGSTVTIGWNIKATTSNGYGNTVRIGGVQYPPMFPAFGGGVAHKILAGDNFNFEGWGIGTDGYITARTQPCGSRTGELEISSTVFYPSSSDVFTFAGTICYETSY